MNSLEYTPIDSQSAFNDANNPRKRSLRGTKWHRWIVTVAPLALHAILALGITLFFIYYVHGNYFNINDRYPWAPVTDANGGEIPWDKYAPLQSDVTTIISTWLVVLRCIATAWTTALCWRGSFLLMNTVGLRGRTLKRAIRYGLLSPSPHLRSLLVWFVAATLFVNIVATSLAPVLTGSISWVPANKPPRHLTSATIPIPVASPSDRWDLYQGYVEWRKRVTIQAAGLVAAAWQPSDPKRVLKRALRSTTGLYVNSTLANVTLPYFTVTSIEWLSNPTQELTAYQQDVDGFWPHLGVGDGKTTITVPGTIALIPDQYTMWRSAPFPTPSTISETRLFVLYTTRLGGALNSNQACRLDNTNITSTLPPYIGLLAQRQFCYAFGWVTYEAGSTLCRDCRLSGPIALQNDTRMALQADPMTNEAWWAVGDVANQLVLTNSSIPSSWGNIDDYVSELLTRSYCGAWNGLNQWFGGSGEPLKSEFKTTVPAIRAQVNLVRVYAWYGTQLLAAAMSLVFLIVLAKSEHPLLGDTSMVPLYVDATEVSVDAIDGMLRATPSGDRWKVEADQEMV